MTAETPRKTQPLKSITIVSGSRKNAARYIHAHLRDRDRILCPEQECSLYDKFGTVTYSAEENVQSLHSALQTALEILESPNVRLLYVRSVTGCDVSRQVLQQLEADVAFHIVDADTFPPVIGITGSDCSGKTVLLNLLKERGLRTFCFEEVYQTLLHSNNPMIEKFYEVSPEIFDDYECDWTKLNRGEMNRLMRRDPVLGQFLANVIHAHVRGEIVRQLVSDKTPAAMESALLFDGKLTPVCNVTVAVTAPVGDRIQRLMDRDGISETYARAWIASHRNDDWYRQRCDYELSNDSDLDAFATKCLAFLEELGIM